MVHQKDKTSPYDIIIIGAGPIGLACGIAARKAGLSHLIIEKGVLVNSLFHFPTNMTFFSTSALLEIGEVPFISHSDKPTRKESLEYFRRVQQSWDLNIHFYEEVTGLDAIQEGIYQVATSKAKYLSRQIIIATGFYGTPRPMNIPGEDLPKVSHYYDDPHRYVGQKLAIIGAANSACDIALEAYHKGAEVTMIIRKDTINPRVKYWIKPNIENRIKEGSIKAYFNTTVEAIRADEIVINTPDGQENLPNDFVLAMTGYQPDYPFLQKMGIQIEADEHATPVHDPDSLETNRPGVYLAGVVNGGMYTSKYFIENTRIHADIILENILKKQASVKQKD